MNHEDFDRLLEQGLTGDPPRLEFREQVLRGSLAMFARRRRDRIIWRSVALAAAAVVIAGVSFFLGRCSRPPAEVAAARRALTETVAVPNDLVAWLEAARLFGQLGMDDRMARAIDHAHSLLLYDNATASDATGPMVAIGGGAFESQTHCLGPGCGTDLHESVESVNRVMAQSLGD
jgi:hypothetical protein